jgi:methyl-accepting chemotaxis protein
MCRRERRNIMSTKLKFILLNICTVLFALSVVATISFYVFHVELERMALESQETRIKTFWEILHQKGSDIHIANGQLMIGTYVVNNDFELPDKLKTIAGGTATIFMGDTRVSTNVTKSDGTRAVGTKLLLDVPYFTAYDPIKNAAGETIGVLYVGVKKSDFFASYYNLRYLVAGIALGLLAISIVVTFLMVGKTLTPLNNLYASLQDISQGEGDLTKRLDYLANNEVGQICTVFNAFVGKLHGIISQVAGSSLQLASSANELQSTSKEMSQSVANLSSQSTSLATAGEEMSATSSDIASNCHHAATNAGGASSKASEGAEVVGQSISVMQAIAERVKNAADTVETLGNRSDQIGTIVGTIEDIADQTNLLALNAAIEAARAGEQGRGFAVVADEVRALAERTTRATKEIGEMIKAIQKETKDAVQTMEQSVAQVEQGSSHVAASGRSLQEILDIINNVTEQISQIATAAEEQTATTREISHNVLNLNELAHQNSSAIQETAVAANDVSHQAEELQRLVNQFKL